MDKKPKPGEAAQPVGDGADRAFLQRLAEWEHESPWQPPSAFDVSPGPEVMLYLVDTFTLWNVVGCTTESRAAQLFALTNGAPPSIIQHAPALAGQALLKAASTRRELDSSVAQTALTMTGFYLSFTSTQKAVAADRGICGHWFALLYHLENGSHTLRPFYAGKPAGRKLEPTEYLQVILDVITGDVVGQTSDVGAGIRRSGGLKLPPSLKSRVNPTIH